MIPTVIIAGTHSGVGKTTIATALMAALSRRGLRVQAFKVGPDFIDPSFHRYATRRLSRNLDGWMLSRESNAAIFTRSCRDADIAVVEGVMGLFDGRDTLSENGSTAEMAKWLGAEVALVVDAAAMARSAGALVHGFETFDPAVRLTGVIFNRVAGEGHYAFLRDAVLRHCRAKPLGYLPTAMDITLPKRHLGLVTADEVMQSGTLEAMADWIESGLDLDGLIASAGASVVCDQPLSEVPPSESGEVRIGVARDIAFCFYYQDNLDLLTDSGAKLVEFSPLRDARLPGRLGGLYLGGGYPELHAAALAANHTMLADIRAFAASGAPLYAECGGFMYLTEGIVDLEGRSHDLAGIFPVRARMQKGLARLGYVEVRGSLSSEWLTSSECARGHEFRHSEIDEMPPSVSRNYTAVSRTREWQDGFSVRGVLGSYIHLHFESCPAFARRFVRMCASHRRLENAICE